MQRVNIIVSFKLVIGGTSRISSKYTLKFDVCLETNDNSNDNSNEHG